MANTHQTHAKLQLRIIFREGAMMGPGKARLLELIRDTGSISAAGRAMEMSYKRAWMLVEEMNAAFARPVVESVRGGPGGGGAHVSPAGLEVLRLYRAIEQTAAQAGAAEIATLRSMLSDPNGLSDVTGQNEVTEMNDPPSPNDMSGQK